MGASRLTVQTRQPAAAQVAAGSNEGSRVVQDSRGRQEWRVVVGTLEECLEGLGDFYHPEFGWIRARGKKEKDPPMFDGQPREFVLYDDLVRPYEGSK